MLSLQGLYWVIIVKSKEEIKQIAGHCIEQEATAIRNLSRLLTDDFAHAAEAILNNENGKVVVCGIGKSANIAQKLVATFNSTGTPAVFMHAADAIHGDLGIVQKQDVVICLSKSGNTPEITLLVPMVKTLCRKLIAIVGNTESYLAKQADYVLDCTVDKEACPNNLAPTASSTAQLVLGDALAVCLISMRGFSAADFARVHPGGALGKQLYLRVSDVCKNNEVPQVRLDADLNTVIYEISSKRLGVTAVVEQGRVVGIVTDGDLRRMLEKNQGLNNLFARDIMSQNPKIIETDELAVKALEMMRKYSITSLLVTQNDIYIGVVHLHDLLKEGIF